MSLVFHDGTHKLYTNYTQKAWNDEGLLQLNTKAGSYDKWLMDTYNNTAALTTLLQGEGPKNCYPYADKNSNVKLSQYIESKESSLIILKGLHQWEKRPNGYDYGLHLSFGLDGWIWHLYGTYYGEKEKVRLSTTVTKGEQVKGEDHEGFTIVK